MITPLTIKQHKLLISLVKRTNSEAIDWYRRKMHPIWYDCWQCFLCGKEGFYDKKFEVSEHGRQHLKEKGLLALL